MPCWQALNTVVNLRERLKKAIDEVQKHDDMIIFIDEIHTLVGAGASEGAMDLANILKPAMLVAHSSYWCHYIG